MTPLILKRGSPSRWCAETTTCWRTACATGSGGNYCCLEEKILSRNVRPFTSAVLPELLGSAPDHDALDGGGYVDQQSGACLPFRRGRLLSLCLGDWPLCGRSKVHHAAATAHL